MPAQTLTNAPSRLVYVNDTAAGIRRLRLRAGFRYVRSDGAPLRDRRQFSRIRRLAIPPAYEYVWLCPTESGRLQATGRDARGRKQYLYRPQWRDVRDAAKFDRMLEFGQVLGRIRAWVDRDLASRDLGKDPVTAAIVRLPDTPCIRVGNDEYARNNRSYGLTTLRNRHAQVEGATTRLAFRGKSGVMHRVEIDDPRVARCRDARAARCRARPSHPVLRREARGSDGQRAAGWLQCRRGCCGAHANGQAASDSPVDHALHFNRKDLT
ncbi:MAG: hypothetical protein ABIX46_09725 [Burkholderiaceae bacterium]